MEASNWVDAPRCTSKERSNVGYICDGRWGRLLLRVAVRLAALDLALGFEPVVDLAARRETAALRAVIGGLRDTAAARLAVTFTGEMTDRVGDRRRCPL